MSFKTIANLESDILSVVSTVEYEFDITNPTYIKFGNDDELTITKVTIKDDWDLIRFGPGKSNPTDILSFLKSISKDYSDKLVMINSHTRPTYFNLLPPELIQKIFLLLTFQSYRPVATTCTLWRTTLYAIQKTVDVSTFSPPTMNDSSMHLFGTRFTSLTCLNVLGHTLITDEGVLHLSKLPELKTLNVSGCHRLSDVSLSTIGMLTKLEHLDLSYCAKITNQGLLRLTSLSRLEFFNVSNCPLVSYDGLTSLPKFSELKILDLSNLESMRSNVIQKVCQLPKLEVLVFNTFQHLYDDSLKCICTHLSGLRKLYLDSCHGETQVGLGQLGKLTRLTLLTLTSCQLNIDTVEFNLLINLTHLDLRCNKMLTDTSVLKLSNLLSLEHLNLGGCRELTDISMLPLIGLTRLRHINIAFCDKITDAGIQGLSHLPLLEHVDPRRCTQLTDLAFKHLATVDGLKPRLNLKFLSFCECQNITDAATSFFADLTNIHFVSLRETGKLTDVGVSNLIKLTNLQQLDLKGCIHITNASLGVVASSFTSLWSINCGGCFNLTDNGIKSLTKLKHLECFTFPKCPLLTDVCLSYIPSCSLRHLDLKGCPLFDNAGLKVISTFAKLQTLQMGNCSRITDKGLKYLEQLRQLQKLTLKQCKEVTNNGMLSISKIKTLVILNLSYCTRLNYFCLHYLTNNLTELVHLKLKGCCSSFEQHYTDKVGLQVVFY